MRRAEEHSIDPDVLAALDAIDATLAGEPVDPRHAELAELALLLAAERPETPPAFASSLDQLVQKRFMAPQAAGRRPRRWLAPATGLATAALAGVVAVIVIGGGGSQGITSSAPTSAVSTASSAGGTSSGQAAASSTAIAPQDRAPAMQSAASAPQPPANGRRIVQAAQLALSAPGNRIDTVAQELFNVVGRESGYVSNSNVTSGTGGYAQFQLRIPSSNLAATMTQLSQLRYATVSSRTDSTQDVNGQYVGAARRLADDRALRTALLKRLAAAVTQTEIDSLKSQLHDAEQAIARDQAALRSLNFRIDYSQVQVTIDSGAIVVPGHHSSGGFTLGRALHDAVRVLTVAAGVALITLAALLPVALLAGLVGWIWWAVLRRRREQALDPA